MSLSKHALTYLKRHYRALYQRAYALGQATSLVLLLVVGSLGVGGNPLGSRSGV